MRAAAVISDFEAEHLAQRVEGTLQPGSVESEYPLPDAGTFVLMPGGIQSSVYGTLAFQTPIVELDLTHVTEEEAGLYGRWRDGYQRNWNRFFDPIAVRFYTSGEKLAADVSVMPLIAGTRYRGWIDVSRGAKIAADTGDPHTGALMHFALAVNRDAPVVKQNSNILRVMAPQIKADPLGWMGEAVAVYVDDDPLWAEVAQAEKPDRFLWNNIHRLPVALHVEVASGIKLAAFLAGARAYVEQSAPEMTVWETKSYRDEPYVKVSPSARAKADDQDVEDFAVYYSASGEALIVTLSESVLKRALDRQLDRRKAKGEGQVATHGGRPWLGENLCVQVERKIIQVLEGLSAEQYRERMRNVAWSNLPILNEWKKLYPDRDPAELHAKIWKRRLVCPGGGNYRWNDTWQTMESTVYGHPGKPKAGASMPKALRDVQFGNFGLTFEEDGLRARAELQRGGPHKPAD